MRSKLFFISAFILYVSSINGQKCPCLPLVLCPSVKPPPGIPFTKEVIDAVNNLRCNEKGPIRVTCCPTGNTGIHDAIIDDHDVIGNIGSGCHSKSPNTVTAPRADRNLLPKRCGFTKVENDKIFGDNVTALGGQPWTAALFYKGPSGSGPTSEEAILVCGGVLISELHVLTAAHCVILPMKLNHVRLGEWDKRSDPDCYTTGLGGKVCAPPAIFRLVAHASVHPLYNCNGNHHYDAAVIRLDKAVTFTEYVQPLCLPTPGDPLPAEAKVIAWGKGYGEGSLADVFDNVLLEVKQPLVDVVTCNSTWNGILDDSQICAGGVLGQDSCKSLSTGVLVAGGGWLAFSAVGITSFCRYGQPGQYEVATSVAKVRDWIIETMEK